MTVDPHALPLLADLAAGSPVVVRAAIGGIGLVVLLAGARIAKPATSLAAAGSGALLALWGLTVGSAWVAPLGEPVVLGVGALAGGGLAVVVARLAAKLAFLAVGAVSGVAAVGVVDAWLAVPWWGWLAGGLLGAAAFPWVFERLLPVLAPAIGAVLVAWAVGLPDQVLLLGGLWWVGAVVQLSHRPEER